MTMRPRNEQDLDRRETPNLISSDKVKGTRVYNRKGEDLGTVDHLMIDKPSGRVGFAVVSFGGFLGMGENYRALPWAALTYDTGRDGYLVDASDEILRSSPEGISDEHYGDRDWGSRVY